MPLSGPAWLTPARSGVAAVFAGVAALMTGWSVVFNGALDTRDDAFETLVMAGPLAALVAASSYLATRRRSVKACAVASMIGCAIAGALVLAVPLWIGALSGDSISLLGASAIGVLVGGPFGAMMGVLPTFVVVEVARGRLRPSHDAIDSGLAVAGSFLFAQAAGSMLLVRLSERSFWAPYWIGAAALAAAGAAAAVAGTVRAALRARWVQRLRRNPAADPAFVVEDRSPAADEAGLLPLFRPLEARARCDAVILACGVEGELPYRERERAVAVAALARASERAPLDCALGALGSAALFLGISALMAYVMFGLFALSLM